MTRGGGFSGRRRNSGYVIIGGTSRDGVVEDVLEGVCMFDVAGEDAFVVLVEDVVS